ncbi:MAG: hypothetical protein Q8S19_05475 [Bacillota bacterium]|nr:hypothetical protein [Bacillota bacterium]
MDVFIKEYKQIFKPLAIEHGFRIHRISFFRIRNDVLQFFLLRRHPVGGRSCTIQWGVLPLCMGLDRGSLMDGEEIGRLISRIPWWGYEPRDPESIRRAISELAFVVKKSLLPLFDQAVDSASAYQAECDYDVSAYGQVLMLSSSKICYAIKTGDYARAIENLRALEAQNMDGHELKVASMTDVELREDYLRRFTEKLSRIRHQIDRLSIPDMDYINDFITTNEEMSLRNLGVKKT